MLFLVSGAVRLGVHSVQASEPGQDYWFSETFTLGDVELPLGVVIRTSDPATTPRAYLYLDNQTETILYVLSLSYEDVLVMKTPDPEYKARLNGAHEVASYLVALDRPANLGMEALINLDRDLEDRNVLNIDPPLVNVSIPATQSSELLLVYSDQVITVPFTVTYALNTNLDNGSAAEKTWIASLPVTAVATPTQAADTSGFLGMKNYVITIGMAVVMILLIAGWLVWKRMTPRG
jgi:hypothetical protein